MKKITQTSLMNSALYYLSKYEASAQMVRDVLHRKLMRAQQADVPVPDQAVAWIEAVIQNLTEKRFIDDRRFIENRIYHLSQQGKSRQTIMLKLKQAGVETTDIDSYFDEMPTELDKARQIVRKKKLGYWRGAEAAAFYQKDLAKLARLGFSFDVAKTALSDAENDIE